MNEDTSTKIRKIKVLSKFQNENEAYRILQQLANDVKPFLAKYNWFIGTLEEMDCKSKNVYGLNVNFGQKICIRLRESDNKLRFLPYESIAHTMLHEMAHCTHGNHSSAFYKLLDQLMEEFELLHNGNSYNNMTGIHRVGGRHNAKRQELLSSIYTSSGTGNSGSSSHPSSATFSNITKKRQGQSSIPTSGGRRVGGDDAIINSRHRGLCGFDLREKIREASFKRHRISSNVNSNQRSKDPTKQDQNLDKDFRSLTLREKMALAAQKRAKAMKKSNTGQTPLSPSHTTSSTLSSSARVNAENVNQDEKLCCSKKENQISSLKDTSGITGISSNSKSYDLPEENEFILSQEEEDYLADMELLQELDNLEKNNDHERLSRTIMETSEKHQPDLKLNVPGDLRTESRKRKRGSRETSNHRQHQDFNHMGEASPIKIDLSDNESENLNERANDQRKKLKTKPSHGKIAKSASLNSALIVIDD